MHTIDQQIKAVQKASDTIKRQDRYDLAECLKTAAKTLIGYRANEQAAERALKRVKELEAVIKLSEGLPKEALYRSNELLAGATLRVLELEEALNEYVKFHLRMVDNKMISHALGSPVRTKAQKLLNK